MIDDESPFRVLLLAELDQPLGPAAVRPGAVLAWELASALAEVIASVGGFSVDLACRRGSEPVLPLITADPDELAPAPATRAESEARQDAVYLNMALSGLFQGYDLIHSLAPLVSTLQVLVAMGHRTCQTVSVRPTHLTMRVARMLQPAGRLGLVGLGTQGPDPLAAVPPPVDLARFRLQGETVGEYLVCDGSGDGPALAVAREAADLVGLPVRTLSAGPHPQLLAEAAALLHVPYPPDPVDLVWPLRALATGTPVVSWPDPALDRYCEERGLTEFVPAGAADAMAEALRRLDRSAPARRRRRMAVVAWSGHRAVASRHREIYRRTLGRA